MTDGQKEVEAFFLECFLSSLRLYDIFSASEPEIQVRCITADFLLLVFCFLSYFFLSVFLFPLFFFSFLFFIIITITFIILLTNLVVGYAPLLRFF